MLPERLIEHLKTKDHVIWDWNGTLLNDVDHAVRVMNALLEEHSLPILDRDRYRNIFDFPVRRYYDLLGFDYERENFECLCHRFVDRFMSGFHELPLFEQTEKVVRHLNVLGIPQSILSATDQQNLDRMISHFHLTGAFEFVFGIENKMATSKLERGRELLRLSKAEFGKTVIVGDTLHDLEVAKDLGISAILVDHGHQCGKRLRLHHDMVMSL